MLYFLKIFLLQNHETSPEVQFIFDSIGNVLIFFGLLIIVYNLVFFFEMAYIEYFTKRLFYNHLYLSKKTLPNEFNSIIKQRINFYNNLSEKHKGYFQHRVYKTIKRTEFIGKELEVSDEMKVVIAATLVKLTFGLRDYQIDSVQRVLIYPKEFYSQTNKAYHKGEFNLGYRALVLSWEDIIYGYEVHNDNINLAVHEFIHAIHFYYMSARRRSTSAAIFMDSYVELTNELDRNAMLKQKLISSNYLREYAYTNQFEFLAVIIETFIETPKEFKSQFPEIYNKVKGMLNFNFEGY